MILTFLETNPYQSFFLIALMFWGIVQIIKAFKGDVTEFDEDDDDL